MMKACSERASERAASGRRASVVVTDVAGNPDGGSTDDSLATMFQSNQVVAYFTTMLYVCIYIYIYISNQEPCSCHRH